MKKNLTFVLSLMTAVLLLESCSSENKINGTRLSEENNLVGLITDSATGKGIAGVPVSDGVKFTVTDKHGVYQMKADSASVMVFYVSPADYKINQNAQTGLPEFYSPVNKKIQEKQRKDFTLEPLDSEEENFSLVMIGDPQCQNPRELRRFVNETIPDIQNTVNSELKDGNMSSVYAVTLGDIVFDSIGLWPYMKDAMSDVELCNGSMLPFFNCMGNHDHCGIEQDDLSAGRHFNATFGPRDYSFNRGSVHIVVMDNIIVTEHKKQPVSAPDGEQWKYYAGFTPEQVEWLKEDLSYVDDKENKMIVLCVHSPFRDLVKDNEKTRMADVMNLLTEFKEAHVMSGHTHIQQNIIQKDYVCKGGLPVYEHCHSNACGSWWASNSDVCGNPGGYNIYFVTGNTISQWYSKGTGRDKDFQLRVYDGNQKYTGSKGYSYTWTDGGTGGKAGIKAVGNPELKGCFVAQVFDGDDTYWTLEMYQNGEKLGDFVRMEDDSVSSMAYAAYCFNELDKNAKTWVSTGGHFWYFKPASGKPAGETGWEVRATRRFPDSDIVKTYYCSTLTTAFSEF